MSTNPVDVLAWISERVAAHESLSESDAYSAQELPKAQAVRAAVAELIAAANAVLGKTPPAGQSGHVDFADALRMLQDAAERCGGAA